MDWTQLVLYELGASAPRELGHVDYYGQAEAVGRERSDGTSVSADDAWYRVPR